MDTYLLPIGIDELTYSYDPDKKNQLMRVVDGTTHPAGFDDDNFGSTLDTTDDYTYDAYGNLTSDQNKGITSIVYNHLNLPVEIIFGGSRDIKYLYDATGKKVLKVVNDGTDVTTTDYLAGFQYETVNSGGAVLTFFPHAEGYVNNTVVADENVYNYVYNYTDHLGNIRVSYTYDPHDHALKIMEENHYYPFGLKHANYNAETWDYVKDENGEYTMGVVLKPVVDMGYQYKYNGKEYQNELDLNLYDYGARNYDPAIGRWMNMDPLAEKSRRWSPYNYCFNNPIRFIDPDGMNPIQRDKDGNIIYVTEGKQVMTEHGSGSTAILEIGHIFADDGTPIEVAKNNSMDAGWDTNCHGTTFADGKYWVNNDQVPAILKGDGYTTQTVANAKEGDKVVYKEGEEAAHSMTVVKADGTANGMFVYGQGGLEVQNHTDKATEGWTRATEAQIVRKETPDVVIDYEGILNAIH